MMKYTPSELKAMQSTAKDMTLSNIDQWMLMSYLEKKYSALSKDTTELLGNFEDHMGLLSSSINIENRAYGVTHAICFSKDKAQKNLIDLFSQYCTEDTSILGLTIPKSFIKNNTYSTIFFEQIEKELADFFNKSFDSYSSECMEQSDNNEKLFISAIKSVIDKSKTDILEEEKTSENPEDIAR